MGQGVENSDKEGMDKPSQSGAGDECPTDTATTDPAGDVGPGDNEWERTATLNRDELNHPMILELPKTGLWTEDWNIYMDKRSTGYRE